MYRAKWSGCCYHRRAFALRSKLSYEVAPLSPNLQHKKTTQIDVLSP